MINDFLMNFKVFILKSSVWLFLRSIQPILPELWDSLSVTFCVFSFETCQYFYVNFSSRTLCMQCIRFKLWIDGKHRLKIIISQGRYLAFPQSSSTNTPPFHITVLVARNYFVLPFTIYEESLSSSSSLIALIGLIFISNLS